MSTDLQLFDSATLPAWIAKTYQPSANAGFTANVSTGFPFLSIEGKSWAVVRDGVRKLVMRADGSGDPASSVEMVLVHANPNLSKVFYKGVFEKGSKEKPDCASADGLQPDPGVKAPQAKSCALCPNNVWGTGANGKGKACQDSRRLAVCSINDLTDPMLLRVPPASLKPLAELAKWADGRQLSLHVLAIKVSFDPESPTPKLVFQPLRVVTQDQAQTIERLRGSDLVAQIIGVQTAPKDAIEASFDTGFEAPAVEVTKAELTAVVQEAPAPKAKAKVAPLRAVKDPESVSDIVTSDEVLEGLDDLIESFDDSVE